MSLFKIMIPMYFSDCRKQTALKLNDLITHCLNMLYSRPTNSRLTELIRWLKVVQDKLNKI